MGTISPLKRLSFDVNFGYHRSLSLFLKIEKCNSILLVLAMMTPKNYGLGDADKDMNIPDTKITLEEVLDQMPLSIQFVDDNGFVRYLNKAAAARPAKGKREVGVNIQNCHARPESLEKIGRILEDFRIGRKEPHYYINREGNKSIMVPIFNAEDEFIGILSYSHPVGYPEPERTFY